MFRSRWNVLLVVATILCTGILGCKWGPHAGKPDPLPKDEYPQIAVLEGLHRAVVVSDAKEEVGPPLQVRVQIRNKTHDDERTIQYRFIFSDASGKRENANPDWHLQHMPARTIVEISGNALDSRYTGWQLEIRPAH